MHVRQGVSSGGWANKVPRPLRGDVGRRAYLPSSYYCYIVTRWVWVWMMPLGLWQAHRGVTTRTHTHTDSRPESVLANCH